MKQITEKQIDDKANELQLEYCFDGSVLSAVYEMSEWMQAQMEPEWISVIERLPTKEEILEDSNWKFSVSNIDDKWVDAAYFRDNIWHNGECEVTPTHWGFLPTLPEL